MANNTQGVDISFCNNYVLAFERAVSSAVESVNKCIDSVQKSAVDFLQNVEKKGNRLLSVLEAANEAANKCDENQKCITKVSRI